MKSIQITEPIYRVCLEIIVTKDDREVDKYLDDYGYTGERTHTDALANTYRLRYSNSSSNHTVIRLKDKSIPQLVHELIHHAMITFMDKDIHISETEDEVLCYYVEFWVSEVMKKWYPKKKKTAIKK
jgi:hypothetical protein